MDSNHNDITAASADEYAAAALAYPAPGSADDNRPFRRHGVSVWIAFAVSVVVLFVAALPAAARANQVSLYEHDNRDGASLTFNQGASVKSLRGYELSCSGIWPFRSCVNWNDQVSSIRTSSVDVTLFEHDDFQGRKVHIGPHATRNLPDFGFNDAVSSVLVEPEHSPTVRLEGPGARTSETSANLKIVTDTTTTREGRQLNVCLIDNRPVGCDSHMKTSGLGDGPHSAWVEVTDPWGHRASAGYHWTVDTTGPAVTVAGPADLHRDTSANFTFQPGDASRVECALDSGPFVPCRSLTGHAYQSLSQGPHQLRVRGFDDVGNMGPEATHAWTVDSIAPELAIAGGPGEGPTRDSSPVFHFRASADADTVTCSLDAESSSAYRPCSGAQSQSYTSLSDGPHVFRVRAKDAAGNLTTVARAFVVDTLAPVTAIVDGPAEGSKTSQRTARFDVDSEPGVRFECALDGAAFTACPAAGRVFRFSELRVGRHVVAVRAIDAAGNVDAEPPARAWTVVSDMDGDGYDVPLDCEDEKAEVNPGARDTPRNGADEDCADGDADFPRIRADIRHAEKSVRGRTVVFRLSVRALPPKSKVTLGCRGKGCTFRTRTIRFGGGTRRRSLAKHVRGMRLAPGATVDVLATAPQRYGRGLRLKVRKGGPPSVTWFKADPITKKLTPW